MITNPSLKQIADLQQGELFTVDGRRWKVRLHTHEELYEEITVCPETSIIDGAPVPESLFCLRMWPDGNFECLCSADMRVKASPMPLNSGGRSFGDVLDAVFESYTRMMTMICHYKPRRSYSMAFNIDTADSRKAEKIANDEKYAELAAIEAKRIAEGRERIWKFDRHEMGGFRFINDGEFCMYVGRYLDQWYHIALELCSKGESEVIPTRFLPPEFYTEKPESELKVIWTEAIRKSLKHFKSKQCNSPEWYRRAKALEDAAHSDGFTEDIAK